MDIFWVAVQQLLGKDPKEAPLRQPPENFSWGEICAKYIHQEISAKYFLRFLKLLYLNRIIYL